MPTRVFLVDGSALAYRAYFAKGPGPAYAYASSLLSLIERERPDYALVAMDTPRPTFRHETFPAYKATRQKTPPDLVAQLPLFERIATALGFRVYGLDGWEADDVIATLARAAADAGHEVLIVTGDKDFMQLVDDRVAIYNNTRPGVEPVVQGADAVRAKFHCRPERVVDVLALMGDSSDNIPGVPKVGEKTALKLIEEFDGIDDLYARLDAVEPAGLRERLREGRESAYMSRDLATLHLDAPVALGLDDLVYRGPDPDAARALFVELDFPSLVDRVAGERTAAAGVQFRIVQTEKDYARFLRELRRAEVLVLDTETTSPVPLEAELVGLAFAFRAGEAWYLPANLPQPIFGPGERSLTARERAGQVDGGMFADTTPRRTTGRGVPGDPLVPPPGSDLARFLADLAPVLADPARRVVGQNVKYDLHVLARYGVEVAHVAFDTLLASFCLDAHQAQHGLDFLALKHLGVTKTATAELIGKGARHVSMWDVPVPKCGVYAGEDAEVTWRLYELFTARLDEAEVGPVFRDIEMPALRAVERIERNGVLVDVGHLRRLAATMGERLAELTDQIHALAGEPFNIDSPVQLQALLYDKLALHRELGVKRIKRTKTGYSTDAETLELLAEHPLPALVLEYRQIAKLKGTYVDSLPGQVHPVTGRIHTTYNQAGAATGRLSSSDPNLQNIPVRTELGRRIREAFVAEPGHRLVAADYSQVELRLMAHLTGDARLLDAFAGGEDIHRRTAALVFGVEPADVTPEMRAASKTINFGIMYGMGPQRLARQIHVSFKEAQEFIAQYFETFSGVRDWIDATREQARRLGYVSTLTGRRRRVEGLDSGDARVVANALNAAINTPIQGTAADLIKIAMARVQTALDERFAATRVILQVHDELVLEVPEADVEGVRALVAEVMSGAMTLRVPLVVDTGVGRNWVEAH